MWLTFSLSEVSVGLGMGGSEVPDMEECCVVALQWPVLCQCSTAAALCSWLLGEIVSLPGRAVPGNGTAKGQGKWVHLDCSVSLTQFADQLSTGPACKKQWQKALKLNKPDDLFFFLAANLSKHLPPGFKLMELPKACGSLYRKPSPAMPPDSPSASPRPAGAIGQVVTGEQHYRFSSLRAISLQLRV